MFNVKLGVSEELSADNSGAPGGGGGGIHLRHAPLNPNHALIRSNRD